MNWPVLNSGRYALVPDSGAHEQTAGASEQQQDRAALVMGSLLQPSAEQTEMPDDEPTEKAANREEHTTQPRAEITCQHC
jgi:hypothetical protein